MFVLYVIAAFDMLSLSLFLPVFAAHVRLLGGSNFFLGCITSAGSLISFVWNPISGSLGDTSGRRNILVKCLLLSLCGNAIMIFFNSLPIIFISRLICSFGSPVGVLIRTIVGDVAQSNEEKSAMFNKIGAIVSVMFMVGAMISGFISELNNGVYYVFALISLVVASNILLVKCLPDDSKSKSKPTKTKKGKSKTDAKPKENLTVLQSVSKEVKQAINNLKSVNWPKYWDLFSIKACIDLSYGVMQASSGMVIAVTFGLQGRAMGVVLTIISLFSITTNVMMLKLKKSLYSDDTGYRRIQHGTTILIIAYFGLGLSPVASLFVFSIGVMSVGRTLLDSTMSEVLTSKTTDIDKGSVMSAFDSVFFLAGFIAPLFSGFLADRLGGQVPLLLCIIPATLGTIIAYKQKVKTE